ncbi:WD40 repeat domain-containing protein [Sporobolomyces koalae]|uniref:WD40 repeat domain-containing protein n=1 Tax=Sporobolomyces koalae TaxID=500713 RepID=UPI00317127ED
MAAAQTLALPSPHSDLITSLLFSPQSTHLATASLDSQIRIVQRNPATQVYDHEPVVFKAHDGPVLSLAWSPPRLGLILASGGVDGTIKIWRQPDQFNSTNLNSNRTNLASASAHSRPLNSSPHSSTRHSSPNWILTATLNEPRGTVRSLGFSPSEFGLKLASISSDGRLRVWESLDPVKADEFTLLEEIDLNALPLHPTTANAFAAGAQNGVPGGGTNASDVSSTTGMSSSNAANSGTTMNTTLSTMTAAGGGAGASSSVSSSVEGRRFNTSGGTVESDGGWSLSWCREHWWQERLAVSSGTNGIIRLFHLPPHGPWSNFLNLYPTRQVLSSATTNPDQQNPPPPVHLPPTCSINWAPPSGRSFQWLAAGSKDSKIRVYKLFPPSLQLAAAGTAATGSFEGGATGEWTAQLDVELDESGHHKKSVAGTGSGAGSSAGGGGSGTRSGSSPVTPSNLANGAAVASGSGSGGIGATKVEWNVTGTVLSTSGGEDGIVRLWKSTYTGQWRQITSLKTETPHAGQAGDSRLSVEH